MTRGQFLLLLAANIAAVASGLHDVADEARALRGESGLVTEPLARAAEVSEPLVSQARLLEMARLVGSSGRIGLHTGREHGYGLPTPETLASGFPHDLAAVAPFRLLSTSAVDVVEESAIPGILRRGDVLVATGNPTSSSLATRLMASAERIRNLPYLLREIADERFVRVYSGMEGGREVRKRGKELVEGATGEVLLSDRDNLTATGWLARDVLLVSRLPSVDGGPDILLLSGGHGAGTQAAELLFRPGVLPDDELERLNRALGGEPYWQVVFEVLDVVNRPPMTLAGGVRVSPFVSPRVFRPRFRRDEVQTA